MYCMFKTEHAVWSKLLYMTQRISLHKFLNPLLQKWRWGIGGQFQGHFWVITNWKLCFYVMCSLFLINSKRNFETGVEKIVGRHRGGWLLYASHTWGFLCFLTSWESCTWEHDLHSFNVELEIFSQVEAEDDPVHLVPLPFQDLPHSAQRHLASIASWELTGTSADARECLLCRNWIFSKRNWSYYWSQVVVDHEVETGSVASLHRGFADFLLSQGGTVDMTSKKFNSIWVKAFLKTQRRNMLSQCITFSRKFVARAEDSFALVAAIFQPIFSSQERSSTSVDPLVH